MELIETTYTVRIKKKIRKEICSIDKWRLRHLEESIKKGYLKNKEEAFKYILRGDYIDEEVELKNQVYSNFPFIQKEDSDFLIKYKEKFYPVNKLYLDVENNTVVMETFVDEEEIDKINYDQIKDTFDKEYEMHWKNLVEQIKSKPKKRLKNVINSNKFKKLKH